MNCGHRTSYLSRLLWRRGRREWTRRYRWFQVSAAELGELCAVRVLLHGGGQDHAVRERGLEVDVLETDPEDPDAVVTGDLEVGAVVGEKPESRKTCGSKTLDRQLSMTFDVELHLIPRVRSYQRERQ